MRDWLITLRKEKGMIQEEVAHKVGVTRQYISSIENGRRPSVDLAMKMADVLEFDWQSFYVDKEESLEESKP